MGNLLLISILKMKPLKNKLRLKMISFMILICIVTSEDCCFGPWSNWIERSLTCGEQEICSERTRNLKTFAEDFWGAFAAGAAQAFGADNCVYEWSVCPNTHTQKRDCINVRCREFDNRIK